MEALPFRDFSGPLAGDPTPDIWFGNDRVYAGGQIRTSVKQASLHFEPQALLRYERGKGLTVGIRGQFDADLAVHAKGYAEGHVVFFDSPTLKGPRGTFIVPIGVPPFVVPVPVVIGVDTYVECTTVGATEFDGTFRAHLSVSASASARLQPSLGRPLKDWIAPGPWKNYVRAEASLGVDRGGHMTGAGGVACATPRIEFPILIAGFVGPFLAIHPELALKTDGLSTTIDLYAGAEIGAAEAAPGVSVSAANSRFFELLLLRWQPGGGE